MSIRRWSSELDFAKKSAILHGVRGSPILVRGAFERDDFKPVSCGLYPCIGGPFLLAGDLQRE